jgi:hypothetical protein
MRFLHVSLLASVLTLLTACGTPPALQGVPAADANPRYAVARSQAVQRTDHMTQHLDSGKTIVYFQNFGGGGVGLGLLGPLGVAANIGMIGDVTKSDVARLQGKVALNAEAAFQQAAREAGFPLQAQASPQELQVTPYLFVSKTNESTVNVSSALIVEGKTAAGPWSGRYLYQLPGDHTLATLAAMDEAKKTALQADATTGFASLLRHLSSESKAAIDKEQKITFKSAYLTPRFEFEQIGSLIAAQDDMVWLRGVGGVYAVRKTSVAYSARKD